MSRADRRLGRAAVVAALCLAVGGAGRAAAGASARTLRNQRDSTLARDSAEVRALLREALAAAQKSPAPARDRLRARIASAQLSFGDFADAERTIAGLDENGRMLDDEFSVVDVRTELVCRLIETRRFSEAERVVARTASADERAWRQAHLASQLVDLPRYDRGSQASETAPLATRWADAMRIATRVPLAPARLDALIALASAADSVPNGRRQARLVAERAIEALRDADRASSRRAMLANLAAEDSDFDAARAHVARLATLDDRLAVAEYMPYLVWQATRDSAHVDRARVDSLRALSREWLASAVREARRVVDPAVRRARLGSVRVTLTQLGMTALADSLVPPASISSGADRGQTGRAAIASARDAAMSALHRSDFVAVRRHVAAITDLRRRGLVAQTWSDLAWGAYSAYRDTAAAYLGLARAALLRERPDSARFDGIAAEIADRQFWIGQNDSGLVTLNLVVSPEETEYVTHRWGTSTASGLTATRLRALADGVRRPAVRDQVLLRVIEGYLAVKGTPSTSLAWARALADSIGTPDVRSAAHLVVARQMLVRGDTSGARADLLALRAAHAAVPSLSGEGIDDLLIALGARDTLVAYARAERMPAGRARALVQLAERLQAFVARKAPYRQMWISNGPDRCRDEF